MKNVFKAVKNRMDARMDWHRRMNYAKRINILSEDERERQIRELWKEKPLISVVTPLYNTPKKFLKELIDSLEEQTYSEWELCLADGSDEEHSYVGELCEKAQKRDFRIKYLRLESNSGIAENTNRCLDIATGEYIGLLDHDDVLHEAALYEMARVIVSTGADFLYSDEVKFRGERKTAVDYNFKNPFGKDELRSHNYICHFTVFKKSLLEKQGVLLRKEYDGSQDHDLFLRLTENAKRIIHIPKVLYFWRVHEESVSMNLDSKVYAVDSAIRAIQEQLDRNDECGVVESNLPYRTIYRVRYKVKPVKVSVIYWTDEMWEKTERNAAIKKLIQMTEDTICEILVPVAEKEDACEYLIGEANIRQIFISDYQLFAMLNRLTEESRGEQLIYLYKECCPLDSAWIREMQMYTQREDVGVVGPKLYNSNGTVYSGGVAFEWSRKKPVIQLCQGIKGDQQGYEAMLHLVRNVIAVTQECFMIKKSTWELLGGFSHGMEGYEVIDFCLKGYMKGLINVWTCFSECKMGGQCKKSDGKCFARKWKKTLENIETVNKKLLLLKLV